MDRRYLYEFYRTAQERSIVLSFMGLFTQQMMVEYGRIINDNSSLPENNRHKLFGVFVELTQNIFRYSSERQILDGEDRGIGVVVVTEAPDCFIVASGNRVRAENCSALADHLARLREMNTDELKAYRKQRRREPRPPGSLGAGLGLIEVARHSCHPLEYHFADLEEGDPFFSVAVSVSKVG